MTFMELQDALIDEVEAILSEVVTTNTAGETVVGVKGYKHQLPVLAASEDDTSKYFPYFIVRLGSGETKDDEDWWHVSTDIIFGVHDASLSDGHEHVLIMCQRVLDRFAAEPLLDHRFRADQDMAWALGDDDTYPFYFAAVSIKFSVPKIGRRNPI